MYLLINFTAARLVKTTTSTEEDKKSNKIIDKNKHNK